MQLLDPTFPNPRSCTRNSRTTPTRSRSSAARPTELRFFPHFVLRSTEYNKEYLDRVIPAALAPIKAREFPGRPDQELHNSLTISEVPIAMSDDNERQQRLGRRHLDRCRSADRLLRRLCAGPDQRLSLRRSRRGLQDGRCRRAPAASSLKKTLQLNFWRPGDTVDPNEEEIRFGCRLDPDPAEQQKILAAIRHREAR